MVIAKLREFSLEDPKTQKICEEHNSIHSRQIASQTECANPPTWFPNFWQTKKPDEKQPKGNLETTTMYNVPEFWEISYKMHPNLQGEEFQFYIEVITQKMAIHTNTGGLA